MTPVSLLNATSKGGSTTKSGSQLNMEQFLQMLVVQLATQNPLEPMSDRDFFAQLAQLGTVQGIDGMQSSLEASQMASLIGKKVTAVRPFGQGTSGDLVNGTVTKVLHRDGEYFLVVKEANGGTVEINSSHIQTIEQ